MTEPELFDVIELLVDLPEDNLRAGVRGAIVECYDDHNYEVEFTNQEEKVWLFVRYHLSNLLSFGRLKLRVGYQYLTNCCCD